MKRLLVLCLIGVWACDRGGTQERGVTGPPTTEDSPPYAEWSLDPTPVARLGAADGPPEVQLSRVAYAARLSDGSLVVVDDGSSELRWFGPDGDFRFRAAGRGEGPGELQWVVGATVTPQDSVVLYDARNRRLNWFGPEGSFSRSVRAELEGTVKLIPFQGTRLLIAEERPTFNFGRDEYNPTRDSLLIMVAGSVAQRMDTLMRRPGREALTWVGLTDGKPTATRQMGQPFGHPTLVGVTSDEIVIVEAGRVELTFFDQSGEAVRLARRTDVNAPVISGALRDKFVTNAVQEARTQGRPEGPAKVWAEGLLEMVSEDQRVSPFDRMLTDPVSSRIWIRDYLFAWDANKAQRWTVYDSIGRVLALVTTPPGLDVMHVSPSHVVGVERDGMGVEYVVAYVIKTQD